MTPDNPETRMNTGFAGFGELSGDHDQGASFHTELTAS